MLHKYCFMNFLKSCSHCKFHKVYKLSKSSRLCLFDLLLSINNSSKIFYFGEMDDELYLKVKVF